jgi:hypothetical protein
MLATHEGPEQQVSDNELWFEILAYHRNRFEGTYIPNLRLSLKKCDSIFKNISNEEFAVARQELLSLRQVTFGEIGSDWKLPDRHGALATKAKAQHTCRGPDGTTF